MPSSFSALQILFILLPGFAAAYIVQLLALRNTQTDLERVIEACLYSFLIYSAFVVLNGGNLPFEHVPANKDAFETIKWFPGRISGLVGITFAFALLGTLYINLDGNQLFRRLKITERTTRRSIWNDIFENEIKPNQMVQVELADGRSVIGKLSYYSDSVEESSLYVEGAWWVDAVGGMTQITGPGILLTKNSTIKSVMLL